MEVESPLISVIVPVYKVEKYLDKCVQSIVTQTYKKLEIILVDDGSPDNCPAMCDEYAGKDERVNVIHKDNGGLSDARNAGLNVCKGDYIMFVDSDDWVEPDYCEKALMSAVEYNVSCVVFGVNNIVNGKCESCSKTDKKQIFSSEEIIRMALNDTFPYEYVPNKIFKRELFLNLRFPKGYLYEDMAVTCQALHRAQKVLAIPNCTYNYRIRRLGSISSESHKPKAVSDRYKIQKQRIPFLIANYPNLKYLVYTKVALDALLGLSIIRERKVKEDMEQFLSDNKDVILSANPKYIPFRLYYLGGLAKLLYIKLHPLFLRRI